MKQTLLILAISAATALADVSIPDTLTVSGTEYEQCTYVKHDAAYLYFTHKDGAGRVELSQLASDLQTQLGYDGTSAEKQKAAERALKEKQRLDSIASAKRAKLAEQPGFDALFRVVEVEPKNVRAVLHQRVSGERSDDHSSGSQEVYISGFSSTEDLAEGDVFGGSFYVDGTITLESGKKLKRVVIRERLDTHQLAVRAFSK